MLRVFSKVSIVLQVLLVCFIASPQRAWAWTEHPLIIREILTVILSVRDAEQAKAESLDAFLMAEENNLVALLAGEEIWARQNLVWYSPLPENMIFKATGNPRDIRERFCHAVRINPDSRFSLYIQYVPGGDAGGRQRISADTLTFLKNTSDWKSTVFVELKAGEPASPLDVVTTASDEPDFGLDIGLYEDDGTSFGRVYGFGKQPFGNPALEYSSQAPFHMGFFHESRIVSTFAPFVNQTYPEERIHLYKSLSEFAFRTGHDYWGWRFMGIGLHYVMDLTQPYHTTLLPGVSTARMLWINGLDLIGIGGLKNNAVQIVSNRHTAIEKFQQVLLQDAYRKKNLDNPVLAMLRNPKACPLWDDGMPRSMISARSNALAGKTDKIMEETMPRQWVLDPAFELGTSPELDGIMDRLRQNGGDQSVNEVTELLKEILEPLPDYTCSYIYSILVNKK